jgi:AcrR family transcriptional regulator
MNRESRTESGEEILKASVPLFAEVGFEGVSMRDVAKRVGCTPAALYYHFPSKEQLYLETVAYAFRKVTAIVKEAISAAGTPVAQLESVIAVAVKMLNDEKPLVRLMQWVMLDRGKKRLSQLGAAAFKDLYLAIHELAEKVGPQFNPSLLAVSVTGMVLFPFGAHEVFRFLPNYESFDERPTVFVQHVVKLLREGLSGGSETSS